MTLSLTRRDVLMTRHSERAVDVGLQKVGGLARVWLIQRLSDCLSERLLKKDTGLRSCKEVLSIIFCLVATYQCDQIGRFIGLWTTF